MVAGLLAPNGTMRGLALALCLTCWSSPGLAVVTTEAAHRSATTAWGFVGANGYLIAQDRRDSEQYGEGPFAASLEMTNAEWYPTPSYPAYAGDVTYQSNIVPGYVTFDASGHAYAEGSASMPPNVVNVSSDHASVSYLFRVDRDYLARVVASFQGVGATGAARLYRYAPQGPDLVNIDEQQGSGNVTVFLPAGEYLFIAWTQTGTGTTNPDLSQSDTADMYAHAELILEEIVPVPALSFPATLLLTAALGAAGVSVTRRRRALA